MLYRLTHKFHLHELPLLLSTVLEVLPNVVRKVKEIKSIQIRKEEAKLSPGAEDMIRQIEKPEDSTKELLELITELSNVAG